MLAADDDNDDDDADDDNDAKWLTSCWNLVESGL